MTAKNFKSSSLRKPRTTTLLAATTITLLVLVATLAQAAPKGSGTSPDKPKVTSPKHSRSLENAVPVLYELEEI
ncbi:hypothetical protein BGW39_006622 [Mortierella sp. 14UC]|nr:hypothetical protein BGW39_006622 [Mortierella sp. 14UC]